ncbi:hypothetical protein BEL04_13575 [Mucilaginibacter sp. PPCGB 2223]|uniref:hypothetical protein n=1 Tax=Mucilaginibacter sp. PPCGB 2223 TaxID=1886027 RepID=UPI0008261BD3|nr:hypothetical protein [Mucilaginibacter sp. PPCGB 2223]OCX52487.1 hypothetical protein BEL04_13575 [Mucilaginibacter sp. PPCGB 2223]
MKKLLIGSAIILIATVCAFRDKDNDQRKANIIKSLHASSMCDRCTLDSIPFIRADSMVRAFINVSNERSYDDSLHTCVWFSADFFKAMCNKVDSLPDGDGIRFYFAKKGKQYSAIPVATKVGSIYSGNKYHHNDYFLPKFLSVNTKCTKIFAFPTDNTPQRGARLYDTLKPKITAPSDSDCTSKSTHYISSSKAYRMVYKNCGKGAKNGKFNATSEWFEISFLQQLAKLVPKDGGIRLYYAKSGGSIIKHGRLFPKGRHGFVLMVTQPDYDKKIQRDKFVCLPKIDRKDFINKIKDLLTSKISDKKLLSDALSLADDTGFGATDNGEECPTNCIGVTWSDPGQ